MIFLIPKFFWFKSPLIITEHERLGESDFVEASSALTHMGGEVGQTACQTDHVTMLRSQDARIILESQNTHPDPPGCSNFTSVNKLQNMQEDPGDVCTDKRSREK